MSEQAGPDPATTDTPAGAAGPGAAAPASAWAVIAGGGTAGHTLPGIAIARALVARGHRPGTIHFVGSARGSEARLVPEAGFAVTLLPGRGIQRRLTLANVGAVWGLLRALVHAFSLLARHRPKVVVAMGGYASVPCALAAVVLRIPIVVAEQNAVPGAANRLTARFAKVAAVSFPGTALPRAVVTGNPVRPEVLAVDRERDRAAARTALHIAEGQRVLLAFGGSLGSLRINEAVVGALPAWLPRRDLTVRHVIGERDWATLAERAPEPVDEGVTYVPVRYEDDMPRAFAAADLVVSRSGATTVAELAAIGVPAILVPLPGAPGDHQTANARALVDADAAVLVPDAELTAERLVREVGTLLDAPSRLEAMGAAARRAANRDAGDAVAALVEEHARD
ncbi:MAG: undecaprenyldiphospho-muramoylpentapeptide beta-N-acetylglucosaminyltransferase [Acidimicrobiales bacterium]|nr:undecaprenyldiphospho-muramoylpentapeptide beta-N-acetylglucosaminyltransferase [Acidimicrobiales bacterium]MCB1015567.1 undecaprenyldiphospho-muramoylpentapeptide beta-N-acetylglucosaminyltransferase [Acidimicrobiales bacterium]